MLHGGIELLRYVYNSVCVLESVVRGKAGLTAIGYQRRAFLLLICVVRVLTWEVGPPGSRIPLPYDWEEIWTCLSHIPENSSKSHWLAKDFLGQPSSPTFLLKLAHAQTWGYICRAKGRARKICVVQKIQQRPQGGLSKVNSGVWKPGIEELR